MNISKKKFIQALYLSGGVISSVAELLDICRTTVYKKINDYGLKEVLDDIQEANLDLAESVLINELKKGSLAAAKYYLDCRGKKRGYGRQQQFELKVDPDSSRVDKIDITYSDGKIQRDQTS